MGNINIKENIDILKEKHGKKMITTVNYFEGIKELIETYTPYEENIEGYSYSIPCDLIKDLIEPIKEKEYDKLNFCNYINDIYITDERDLMRSCAIQILGDKCKNEFLKTFDEFILNYEHKDDIILYGIQKKRDLTLKDFKFRDQYDALEADNRLKERKYFKKYGNKLKKNKSL